MSNKKLENLFKIKIKEIEKDEEGEELISYSREQEQDYKEEQNELFLTSREGTGCSKADLLNSIS